MSTEDLRGLSQRAGWAGDESIVSRLMAQALARPELISLAAGFVDRETLPLAPTRAALEALWSNAELAQTALQYGTTIGYRPLREAICQRLIQADHRPAGSRRPSIDQIVLTAGSNQLLHLVSEALLDPGDIVVCAEPTYFVYLGMLRSVGARAVGVQSDQEGLIPEALEERLAQFDAAGELGRVKAIYVTTYYDNPSGVNTSLARRQGLVEIARRWSRRGKIYLIEDAAYRELRYFGDELPSLHACDADGDTVVHAGTFSKSYSPGIRVGWGVLPQELLRPVLAHKGNIDFGSPHFNQVLMATVLQRGLLDAHLAQLREHYRQKIAAILDAAAQWLAPIGGVQWLRPSGGLYLWLCLPEEVDTGMAAALFQRAVSEGVLYLPGACCYPQPQRAAHRNRLRLSFGVPSCEEIRRGVEALARAIRRVLEDAR